MKTIAIDKATAKLIDELTQLRRLNRSALVRTAVRQYAERERRQVTETKDGEIFRKHRKSLARQARALISEQARS
jgi:predicted transcriptional regulator